MTAKGCKGTLRGDEYALDLVCGNVQYICMHTSANTHQALHLNEVYLLNINYTSIKLNKKYI